MFMCVCRDNHQSSSRHNLDLHENVVAGGEGDTDEDEEEVGDGEVQDQQVRRVLHLRVRHHLLRYSWRWKSQDKLWASVMKAVSKLDESESVSSC